MTTPADPKPLRRFLGFSLKGLLAFVLVIAVLLGLSVHEAKKQGIAVKELEKMGCMVEYDLGRGRRP